MLDSFLCDGNTAAPNYDSEIGICKCESKQNSVMMTKSCSDSTPFCVEGRCLCSKTPEKYIKGVSTRGTCRGTKKCLDDGSCAGRFLLPFNI